MKYLNKALDLAVVLALYYGLYICKGKYEAHVGHTYQHLPWAAFLLALGGVVFAAVAVLLCCRGVLRVRLTADLPMKLCVGLVLLALSLAPFIAFVLPVRTFVLLVAFSPYAQTLLGVWLALIWQDKWARA